MINYHVRSNAIELLRYIYLHMDEDFSTKLDLGNFQFRSNKENDPEKNRKLIKQSVNYLDQSGWVEFPDTTGIEQFCETGDKVYIENARAIVTVKGINTVEIYLSRHEDKNKETG